MLDDSSGRVEPPDPKAGLSQQLYSLVMEYVLYSLSDWLSGVFFLCRFKHSLTLSSYADDINILVSNHVDVQCLQDTPFLYEKAMSLQVN